MGQKADSLACILFPLHLPDPYLLSNPIPAPFLSCVLPYLSTFSSLLGLPLPHPSKVSNTIDLGSLAISNFFKIQDSHGWEKCTVEMQQSAKPKRHECMIRRTMNAKLSLLSPFNVLPNMSCSTLNSGCVLGIQGIAEAGLKSMSRSVFWSISVNFDFYGYFTRQFGAHCLA